MATVKEKTQRRVYVLPAELVERIVAYQNELGLGSEVEAARRLLDGALKSRDTYSTLIARFRSRLLETKIPAEIAKEVLVGHPLVKQISFRDDHIEFAMKDDLTVTIWTDGRYRVEDEGSNCIDQSPKPLRQHSSDMDDDIPF